MSPRVALLRFRLGEERFAIKAAAVVEVIPSVVAGPLPFPAGVVVGSLVVRGQLMPLLDVRSILRLPERPVQVDDHFLVLDVGGRALALVTEGVDDFATVDAETLVPARMLSERGPAGAEIAQLADGTWAVLDPGAFLGAAERAELDAALGAGVA